jgi:lipopolysaccharide biosynthesis glycosyltransferase
MNSANNIAAAIDDHQPPRFVKTLPISSWGNRVIVVLTSDENYAAFIAVTMFSIVKNTKSFVEFHILDNGILDKSRQKIEETLSNNLQHTIEYHNISHLNLSVFQAKHCKNSSVFARYYVPQILRDKKRALYLDSDIVFAFGDIAELYNQDLEGKTIGAVIEDYADINYDHYNKLHPHNLGKYTYFNTGVLLYDIQQFNEIGYLEILDQKTIKLKDDIKHLDQDIMMIVFENDFAPLDYKFNFQSCNMHLLYKQYPSKFAQIAHKSFLVHFAGKQKPWNSHGVPYSSFFFDAAIHTAFSDDICSLRLNMPRIYISKLDKNAVIPVAFICEETRAPLLAIAMFSILENTNYFIEFFIFSDGLSRSSKQTISATIAEFKNFALTYVDIASLGFAKISIADYGISLNCARFFAPYYLSDKEKIIYCDPEVIVHDDIAQIYEVDLDHYTLGAVLDFSRTHQKNPCDQQGISSYFNASMLLINTNRFIAGNYKKELLKLLSKPDCAECQKAHNALNAIFVGNIKPLEYRFNVQLIAQNDTISFSKGEINDIVFRTIISNYGSLNNLLNYSAASELFQTILIRTKNSKSISSWLKKRKLINQHQRIIKEIKLFNRISIFRILQIDNRTFYILFGLVLLQKALLSPAHGANYDYGLNRALGKCERMHGYE